jgi:hypothetical protein
MRTRTLLAFSIIIGALVAVVTSVAAGVMPKSWGPYLWLAWPISVVLILVQLRLGFAGARRSDGSRPVSRQRSAHSRERMLANVSAIWIDKVLKPSIYQEQRIPVRLERRPDLICDPWDVGDCAPAAIPGLVAEEATPAQFVRGEASAMLIVGDAGSGKTILLLELLRDLLADAAVDQNHPLPVMFRLTSWTSSDQPLEGWLENQLCAQPYGVARDLAREWIADDQVLPLLDGLDEVPLEHRGDCVRAINAFRARHGTLPLVVTSRADDYKMTPQRMHVQIALVAQPLSRSQIEEYLRRFGAASAGVREALSADPVLWGLLQTPFWLSVAMRAFEDLPVMQVSVGCGSLDERRRHLLATFTSRALRHRKYHDGLSEQHAMRWLAYMARALAARIETTFSVRRITRSWLPPRKQGAVIAVAMLPALSLIIGFSYLLSGISLTTDEILLLILTFLIAGFILLVEAVFGREPAQKFDELSPPGVPNRRIAAAVLAGQGTFVLCAIWVFAAGVRGLCEGMLEALTLFYLGTGRRYVGHFCDLVLLAKDGLFPLRYRSFLEYAVYKMLLIRVGNDYAFCHRLLLEYFAQLEIPDLPREYLQCGLPVTDFRPEFVLQDALRQAKGQEWDKWDKVLSALRYAGTYMSSEAFSPIAIKIAELMQPSDNLKQFIAAHRLIVEAGHPEFSPQAALRLADALTEATHRDPYVEQEWLDKAKELYQLAVDSRHRVYADAAAKQLAKKIFKVARDRIETWDSRAAVMEAQADLFMRINGGF